VASALEWITRLVSLDTTSRGSNLILIDLVAKELRRHGLKPAILPNEDWTKANLVVTIPARDGSTDGGTALSGHTDVVPVDGQVWDTDPFTPQVRDGLLFGRGTADMKSFIGVILAALPALTRAPLLEPVHIMLSYDEEVGCLGGKHLVNELAALNIRPAVCIVGEPTGMRVISAHKSIDVLELTVNGVSAHSSMTPRGVNAIEYACRAVVFIRALADELRDNGPYDNAYDVPYTTASVNGITGGVAKNIVADRCQVEFEFRSISAVDRDRVGARIETFCADLQREMRRENPKARVDLRRTAAVPGLESDPGGRAVRLGEAAGGIPSTSKVTYGSEAGLFQAAGFETIVCGPGEIQQAHTANEYVELDQIRSCATFLDNLVGQLSAPSPSTTYGHGAGHDQPAAGHRRVPRTSRLAARP
jgi:acetylornithine deacetylase